MATDTRGGMNGNGSADQLSQLFQLLADRTRVRILLLLAEGERNVTGLCRTLELPQPTVSHHLALLRGKGLLSNRRNGKEVYYSIGSNLTTAAGATLSISLDKYKVNISEV